VSVGDENAGKMFAEDALGRLAGAVRVELKEGQLVVTSVPYPIVLAIVAPGGFIAMGDGQGANFLPQVFVERDAPSGRLAVKAVGTGWHEVQAKEVAEETGDFAVGDIQFIAQIRGGRFGDRADISAGQFSGT